MNLHGKFGYKKVCFLIYEIDSCQLSILSRDNSHYYPILQVVMTHLTSVFQATAPAIKCHSSKFIKVEFSF
jgi:hypothetical protein